MGEKQSDKPTARDVFLHLANRMPLGQRADPLLRELYWFLCPKPPNDRHELILPAYCYSIFEKIQKTVFGAFPAFDDTVFCPDPSKLANVKSYSEAKQFIKIDWYRFGKVIGLIIRGVRFFELELEEDLEKEGLLDLKPDEKEIVAKVFGEAWLKEKGISAEKFPENIMAILKNFFPNFPDQDVQGVQQKWSNVVYQWSPEAMSEFNRGMAEGMNGFINETGELVGASSRFNNYAFCLILWPEMGDFLARSPLPDRTEVFEWIKPLHTASIVNFPNIDYFRDFCESIGLKFIGRLPKKDQPEGMP